jgi:uncharacterized protein YeeX (DUF496 family)
MEAQIQISLFDEVAEFIASEPSLEAISEYRVSSDYQQRVDDLLEKNREEGLPPAEREELEKILAISHLMTLAKAKARLKLASRT